MYVNLYMYSTLNIEINSHNNSKINDWISNYLYKLLGVKFNVFNNEKGLRVFKIESSNKRIIFDNFEPEFYLFGTNKNLNCQLWDSKSENFTGIIDDCIPMPTSKTVSKIFSSQNNETNIISYDIPGLIYWNLNRLEEINTKYLDKFGRFQCEASHAFKFNYLSRPIVDEWLYILKQVFYRVWPELSFKKSEFKIIISHDVDRPSRYDFKKGFEFYKYLLGYFYKGRFDDFKNLLISHLPNNRKNIAPNDPFNSFDWLMQLSESHGLKSVFYFIAGGNNKLDADYSINDPKIVQLMKNISSRGHEIGIHPSFECFNDLNKLSHEVENLKEVLEINGIKQKNIGGRMHYLRWSHPSTLQILENCGLEYDSSLGYSDHIGFRCGTSYEFNPINPVSGETLKIRLKPLHIMDVSITDDKIIDEENYENIINSCKKIIFACEKCKGDVNLLWHNNNLKCKDSRKLYKNLIDLCFRI